MRVIRVGSKGPKTPHPRVGTPTGGDVIEHPLAINPPVPDNAVTLSPRNAVTSPPSPDHNAVTQDHNAVTPPTVTRYAPSKEALRQKAYRERKKAAGPVRIAVPCHPDHLGGLDV